MARDFIPELTEQLVALRLTEPGQSGALNLDSFSSSPQPHHMPSQAFAAPSRPRRQKCRVTKKRSRRKRSLAQIVSFSPLFVRKDAILFFAHAWKPTLIAWNSLLLATTIPPTITGEGLNISAAVEALNHLVAERGKPLLPSRFGYVQLSRFLGALEDRIKQGREHGFIPSERGRVHASIAIDMYLEAQGTGPDVLLTRSKIWEYKRIGRRWEELVGPSVLLLSIYSDVAEAFVHVPLEGPSFQG